MIAMLIQLVAAFCSVLICVLFFSSIGVINYPAPIQEIALYTVQYFGLALVVSALPSYFVARAILQFSSQRPLVSTYASVGVFQGAFLYPVTVSLASFQPAFAGIFQNHVILGLAVAYTLTCILNAALAASTIRIFRSARALLHKGIKGSGPTFNK